MPSKELKSTIDQKLTSLLFLRKKSVDARATLQAIPAKLRMSMVPPRMALSDVIGSMSATQREGRLCA